MNVPGRHRRISVVVDNDSWILPWAEEIVRRCFDAGDEATLVRSYADVSDGDVAFLLGCVGICPPEVLARNKANLLVHAGDLPRDRGFSPWTWGVLRGDDTITVCLLHAAEEVDAGAVVFRDVVPLKGTELVDDLRSLIGMKTVEMVERVLADATVPAGDPQVGEPTWLPRRRPADSQLDPNRTLREQFNLLRVVDNERYPAFFELSGERYLLEIRRAPKEDTR